MNTNQGRVDLYSPALIGSLGVIGGYMVVRACVYRLLPVTSQESWFFRDTLMSVPRLAGFIALFLLDRRWKTTRVEAPSSDTGRLALLGFVPTALWAFYFCGGGGLKFQPFMMVVGVFTSLIVGLWEEYAFRGTLLAALRQRFSVLASIVLSNVVFAVYHFQAQSVRSWGAIFLTGAVYANLRLRGLGIGWLALIHGVTDASFFYFPGVNPDPFSFRGVVLQAGLLLYAVATFPRRASPVERP